MDFASRNSIWSGQVRPRLFGRLFNIKIIGQCLAAALALSLALFYLPGGDLSIVDFAEAGIAFASLSFAGCLAVLALSLSLPSRELVEDWATTKVSNSEYDVYTELVFSLFWAALMQLAFVLLCGVAVIMGGDYKISAPDLISPHNLLLVLSLTGAAYCFRELYTVLRSALQIANATVLKIQNDRPSSDLRDG